MEISSVAGGGGAERGSEHWSVNKGPKWLVNQNVHILRFFPFNFLHKSESKAGRIAGESTRSGKKRVRAQRKQGWGMGFLLNSAL